MPKNKLFSVKKDIIIPLKGGGIMAQGKQNVTTLSHIGAQKHKRVKWSLLYCSLFSVTIGGTIGFFSILAENSGWNLFSDSLQMGLSHTE